MAFVGPLRNRVGVAEMNLDTGHARSLLLPARERRRSDEFAALWMKSVEKKRRAGFQSVIDDDESP